MSDAELQDQPPPPEEAPKCFTYPGPASFELAGPAGSKNLDCAVAHAVKIGLHLQFIEPGRYRLWGASAKHRAPLQEWIDFYKPDGPIVIRHEDPPDKLSISFEFLDERTPARCAFVHGAVGTARLVTRAVEVGLKVQCIGVQRFKVSGTMKKYLAWTMAVFEVPQSRALEILKMTLAEVNAEDAPVAPVAVDVHLPVRETTSVIERGVSGDILKVSQTERTIE